jgi:hypothetical protein
MAARSAGGVAQVKWYEQLYKVPPGPDRVERLLDSCRAYYRHGDTDIAVLLLHEIEKELTRGQPIFETQEYPRQ